MGTKYIVEVEDKPFELLSEDGFTSEKLFRVKGFNSLVFDWNGLNTLTPYTEPDTEKVREDAFKNRYDAACKDIDIKSKTNAAYRKGLEDAWETVRKIVLSRDDGGIEYEVKKEIFGHTNYNIIRDFNVSEVIEEIRAHEQAQKEKEEQEEKDSVTAEEVMRQYLDTFCKRHFCSTCPLHTSEFTCGRGYHFTTKNPISNEEVRRAYAKVLQHEEVG